VITGLRLSAEDPESLLRYLLARERHHFWQAHRAERQGAAR
jgi:hypothetical protein